MTGRSHYQQKASECFNKVADILRDGLSSSSPLPFWHVGRTLNTCQDYIARNGANVPADKARFAERVLPECTAFYREQARGPDTETWWWDDYGWWGLAHLATGNVQDAVDCWRRMQQHGVDTVGPSSDYLGGCWNHRLNQDPPGCENCVTNSTFYLLSLRLLNHRPDLQPALRKQILETAHNWRKWFVHWNGRPGAIRNPLQLLRERPVGDAGDHFASGAPETGGAMGWIWTGDQGLALAWTAEAFELATADWDAIYTGENSDTRDDILRLAQAIRQGMTPLFDADGVLHEAPFTPNWDGPYNNDYNSGRGVFMRYLARADASFRKRQGWIPSDVQILRTADAVIARMAETQPAMYTWNYAKESDVLQAWKDKVHGTAEGNPSSCHDTPLSNEAANQLVFYGIALDALTAATAVPSVGTTLGEHEAAMAPEPI